MTDLTLPPTLVALGRRVKAMKTRAVRANMDDGQVPHVIDVYRKDKRLLRVAAPNPEDVLDLLHSAPGAMCADYMAMAVDSWGAQSTANPITGQQWDFGDMEKIVEQDLGLERGLIREAISLFGFQRDGTHHLGNLPYHHDRAKRTIEWDEQRVSDSTGVGRFPRVAREGFERSTIIETLLEKCSPLSPDDATLDDLTNKTAVSYVLRLPPHLYVLEGPKGPPLSPDLDAIAAMMS